MDELINAILAALEAYFDTILPQDTAVAVIEASKDLFVRFYALAWEYIVILGG